MLIMSSILLYIKGLVLWWSLTSLFTMVGLTKMKVCSSTTRSMVYYYVVQEVTGLMFIVGMSDNFLNLMLLIKGGFAPFHGWMGKVISGCFGLSYAWMLTIQKLPYYIMISQVWTQNLLLVILLGSLLPVIQGLSSGSVWSLVFLTMTSSGNNLLLLGMAGAHFGKLILVVYSLVLYQTMVTMPRTHTMPVSYELLVNSMSLPLTLPFSVKVWAMVSVFEISNLLMLVSAFSFLLNLLCGYKLARYLFSTHFLTNKVLLSLTLSLTLLVYV